MATSERTQHEAQHHFATSSTNCSLGDDVSQQAALQDYNEFQYNYENDETNALVSEHILTKNTHINTMSFPVSKKETRNYPMSIRKNTNRNKMMSMNTNYENLLLQTQKMVIQFQKQLKTIQNPSNDDTERSNSKPPAWNGQSIADYLQTYEVNGNKRNRYVAEISIDYEEERKKKIRQRIMHEKNTCVMIQNIDQPMKYKHPILLKNEISKAYPNAIRANLLRYGDIKIYFKTNAETKEAINNYATKQHIFGLNTIMSQWRKNDDNYVIHNVSTTMTNEEIIDE